MAFSGPTSYVPTIGEFLAHWSTANKAGQGELALPDGTKYHDLDTYRTDLEGLAATIESKLNLREVGRGTINLQKAVLLDDLRAFNRYVRGGMAANPYTNALPDIPNPGAGEGRTLRAFNDGADLWKMVNAATISNFTPPLVLPSGRSVEDFETSLAALKQAYDQYNEAVKTVTVTLAQRNEMQTKAYNACRDYRALIEARFAPDSALVQSLPRLNPAPGSTPDPVVLTAEWDAATEQAKLTWTASENENVDRYSVRYVVGDEYEDRLETTLGSVEKDDPREYTTNTGLNTPGAQVAFKIYVILTTGNERGSNPVVVERP